MKPNLNDIKALIEQAEKLKQEVEQLKKKSFLTPVQSEAVKAGTDTPLYLLRLSRTNEEECLNNFGTVDNYFVPTGSVNKGRFAQNLRLPSAIDYGREEPEGIEWYNPKKHTGLVVRYDFDEKKFWHFLNQYKAKQRQLYWENHIQPLIAQLDTDLTPSLPFMKQFIDTEKIQKAINTAEVGTLSAVIYEFKKIQKVLEVEVKQEQEEIKISGGKTGTAGDKKKPEKKLKPLPKGFSFGDGQAFFKSKDLKLPAGEAVDILKKLVTSLGNTVKHTELDSQSSNSNASDFLRGRIAVIKTALKKKRVTYKVRSIRGIGYILERT